MTDTQNINSPTQQSGRRRSDRIVGASSATRESVDQATRAARSSATVLVTGPVGSGRSHLARAIHAWSTRANSPLVVLSAAATQDEQQQQRELFGAGSASEPLVDGSRDGALSRAADGTLLIESIDQFTEGVRAALASAIAQQRFTRVGESEPVSLRARVVATALSVGEANLSGAECEAVSVAALADRTEDVLPLAAHFLAQFTAADGTELVGFTNDARRWLLEEQWLGNVEELAERIRQAVRLAGDGAISAEALMLASEGDEVPSFKEAKRAFETRYVEGLLRRCNGNISRAARLAKKDRKDFYDVIRRTGVDPAQFRP
jgi:two-component system response regulator GlrR